MNEHLVVREAKHREAADALRLEACLLETIAPELPVAVPRPSLISIPGEGSTVLAGHPLVPGVALTPERWKGLPRAPRQSVAREVGAFLAGLHSLDPGMASGCGLDTIEARIKFRELQERLRTPGDRGAMIEDPVRTRLLVALQRYCTGDLAWGGAPAILNGDVSPEHVLFDEDSGRLTGVIDWGDARLGDPPRDFIFLYEDWGTDFLDLALEGYGSAGDPRFLAQVYVQYLADQLEWTMDIAETPVDRRHGIAGLRRGLAALQHLDAADEATGPTRVPREE